MLALIVAVNKKRVIGKDGWMPWHVSEDLKFFKETTLQHNVVFGRTTFDGFKSPLPDRTTYVVTSKTDLDNREDIHVIHDFSSFCQVNQSSDELYFVAGGARIYEQALPYCNTLYISYIDNEEDGDTYFPLFDEKEYKQEILLKKEMFTVIRYSR